jgi:hypothetical protein
MTGLSKQREAEMERGRQLSRERSALRGDVKDFQHRVKEADARIKEDEDRRHSTIIEPVTAGDKELRDITGAAVQDQAQTLHEAILHLADRQEPIIDFRRQRRVDLLEDETVDTAEAHEIAVQAVLAQAVNQPTVLANNQGQETEDKPLNISLFADDELALTRVVLPPDELTPKTRDQAEEAAVGMVPEPERVVGDGKVSNDDNPETIEAVDVFCAAPDISMSYPIPGDVDKRLAEADENEPVAKRRGRPPGSKNK